MLVVLVLLLVPLSIAGQALEHALVSKLQLQGCDVRVLDKVLISINSITCNNTGLKSVPQNIPTSLFELLLPNNAITIFPCAGLGQLYSLNLRNNSISYVAWKCLKNMPSLAYLDLSYNQIFCLNLYPVKTFLANLRKIDLSYNKMKVIPVCDLGINTMSAKERYVHYEVALEGNPFNCGCKMAWLVDVAILAERCRLHQLQYLWCVNFLNDNPFAREMHKDQSLFRCKSPPELENVELYTLNISMCYTWNEADRRYKLMGLHNACPLNYPCPKTDIYHYRLNVNTSTALSPTSSSKYSSNTPLDPKLQQTKICEIENTSTATSATLTDVKKATAASSHVKSSPAMLTEICANGLTEVTQVTNMTEPTDSLDMTKEARVVKMTEMTQTQDMPETTQALNVAETTQAHDMTEMTQTLNMAEMTQAQDMTKMTQALNITEMTQAQDMTEMTQTLKTIEMSQGLNTTEMTPTLHMTEMNHTLDMHMTETTKTSQMIETKKSPELTKKPAMTETTKPSEMTETTKTPEMTLQTLPSTELPQTHDKSAAMGPGWVMTIVVVTVITVVCGVVFAVYWVMFRRQSGKRKNASPGHQSEMAAGQTVNINSQTHLGDLNTDSGLYETIPDTADTDDRDAAYAKSSYVFDIPQYHLSDIEMSEIFKARGKKVSAGQSKQGDQHTYANRSVSIPDGVNEMAPYRTSYMADVFPPGSGKYV
ncbi:hypothetical protein Bbelb_211920 [Branchiostoma belcheri]|nr:hypothetical protein Bbelb_211920 [Branchiostoma belcheri]